MKYSVDLVAYRKHHHWNRKEGEIVLSQWLGNTNNNHNYYITHLVIIFRTTTPLNFTGFCMYLLVHGMCYIFATSCPIYLFKWLHITKIQQNLRIMHFPSKFVQHNILTVRAATSKKPQSNSIITISLIEAQNHWNGITWALHKLWQGCVYIKPSDLVPLWSIF